VLLKNEHNLLPLDKSAMRSVAVIGPLADRVMTDLYNPRPPYVVSPLAGIRNALVDHNGTVLHHAPEHAATLPLETATTATFAAQPPIYVPERDIPAAVELACAAEVAIVCVGNNPMCGGWAMGHATPSWPSEGMEALDRRSLTLEQEELIQAVYAANRNTIVVLIASFPYAINWTQEHIPAIIHMGHGSQELGNALADVLFGDYNPAGRLVQTWPQSIEQLPRMLDYDIRHGRTYMYFQGAPLYPFGYGLSYTTFGYSNLQLSSTTLPSDAALTINLDVTNTGDHSGDEVVQLYVRHVGSAVARPDQELKGFCRVSLRAGETQTVTLHLAAHELAYWSSAEQRFVVEHDTIQIRVGRSSADIQLEASVAVVS
jgi:beta-glucosidase